MSHCLSYEMFYSVLFNKEEAGNQIFTSSLKGDPSNNCETTASSSQALLLLTLFIVDADEDNKKQFGQGPGGFF